MLAQELINSVKKPMFGGNVVFKLDMAKAFDRVSWPIVFLVLRRFGIREIIIDMIQRILSNNQYFVIVNGTKHGFFYSTRDLKQEDPLSTVLFMIRAEVLLKTLNNLNQNPLYYGFHMSKHGPQINHLNFANDVILFTIVRRYTL